ncbi:MAG TPA: ligase-associated DNA damage response endonuclease PdeM [Chthoniobacterales bacterium]
MIVDLAGESVTLDADRALVWRDIVVVADPHFGKDASARAHSIGIPPGTTSDDLVRLDALLARHTARELWLLGDVFDSEFASEPATIDALAAWRTRHDRIAMRMVAGNHDRRALALTEAAGFELLPDLAAIGPWRLSHHPQEAPAGHVLCGHIHPGLLLKGPGRERLRLPAFILGTRRSILPAFGGMTGLASCELKKDERGFVIAGRILGPLHTSWT